MWTWNEFLIPLVMVTDESLRTAPLGLAFFQGQYTQGFTLLAAGAVIVALPVVVALPLPPAPLHRRACSRAPSGSEGPATRVVTGTCGRALDRQT